MRELTKSEIEELLKKKNLDSKVVSDLTDDSGFVPVDILTLKTSVPNIYAVGNVASLKLPNGKPHPKAGTFSVSQAATVANNITALIEGKDAGAKYTGKGVCIVDVGQNKAAPVDADLLAPEGPKMTMEPPSKEGLDAKQKFESEHFDKWFIK